MQIIVSSPKRSNLNLQNRCLTTFLQYLIFCRKTSGRSVQVRGSVGSADRILYVILPRTVCYTYMYQMQSINSPICFATILCRVRTFQDCPVSDNFLKTKFGKNAHRPSLIWKWILVMGWIVDTDNVFHENCWFILDDLKFQKIWDSVDN